MTIIHMPELSEHWHNVRKDWIHEASRCVQHIDRGWHRVEELASVLKFGEMEEESWWSLPEDALSMDLSPDWVSRWEIIDELQRRSYLEMSVNHQIRGSYPDES